MKKRFLTLITSLSVLAISVTSCSSNKKTDSNNVTEKEPAYNLKFNSVLAADEQGKQLEIEYDIPLKYLSFNKSGTEFNGELALVSFAFTVNCAYKNQINSVYNAFGFDNIFNSIDYDHMFLVWSLL